MPISLAELANASLRFRHIEQASTLTEARALGVRTVFLSHSHKDRPYVQGLVQKLRESGWRVYIDWLDTSMPPTPNRDTAAKIKTRIKQTDLFLFLATPSSMGSRWCPWEIGYADGVKPIDAIVVVSTKDANGTTHGSEYLDLYRRLDVSDTNELAVWQPGQHQNGVLARNL